MLMTKLMLLTCLSMLFTGQVAVAEAPAAQAGLSQDASIDRILEALHARGERLEDFVADVSMEEMDNITANDKTRTGRVWYDRLEGGAVRMRILFDSKILDGRVIPEKVEYLLTDGWLTDRDYTSKIEINRQVLRPGEQIDLLKLGEGPFPLPIGQDPQEVKRLFEVEKGDGGEDAPQGSIHVRLTPKPGTEMARRFASLEFWVDTQTNMPIRIVTMDQNMAGVQTTEMKDLQVNAGIDDKHFVLEDISRQDWTRRDEPFDR